MIPASQTDTLASMGFVVVIPNYRLCPQVSMYDGPWEDAKDVLAWCRGELGKVLKEDGGVEVDSGRVAAMGHSAGATLALLL
ncbi:hypothetical protein HK104_011034, partial [Borealophlyctis nickersoniae]